MLTLYICLGYLLAPFALAVHLWRGFADRDHWRGLSERFGGGAPLPAGGLWVHAVSVGEIQAAVPLIRGLRARFPERPILVTASTLTGRARAAALFGAEASVRYLPYDLPVAARRFLRRAQPQVAIVLETELWPNLYRACARRGIPIVLGSARVSERSVRRYLAFGSLIPRTLATGVLVAAQSTADAERFVALGASRSRVHVTGNIKFDIEIAAGVAARGEALRAALGPERAVWVAGSTHEGEEEMLLEAQRALATKVPAALLVMAPRHPPRFAAVAALLERERTAFVRHSAGTAASAATSVLLLDTLGELVDFYAAGDIAFVGGSLVPVGGHNLLEPAALGKPALSGPYTANAAGIAPLLVEAGALRIVADPAALVAALEELALDPAARSRAGAAGREAVAANGGAVTRLIRLVEPLVRSDRPAAG